MTLRRIGGEGGGGLRGVTEAHHHAREIDRYRSYDRLQNRSERGRVLDVCNGNDRICAGQWGLEAETVYPSG